MQGKVDRCDMLRFGFAIELLFDDISNSKMTSSSSLMLSSPELCISGIIKRFIQQTAKQAT